MVDLPRDCANASARMSDLPDSTSRFLQLCLRSRWDSSALPAALAMGDQSSLDWDGLVIFANQEGLAPLLYDALRSQHLATAPAAFVQALERSYQQTAVYNTLLSLALGDVLRWLAAARIPVIVLKGAALGETLYGNPALRPIADIDLLLRPEDVPATCRLLAEQGYYRFDQEPQAGLALAFENEIVLRKPDSVPVTLELHWSLLDSPYYQRRLQLDWFWQTARALSVAGVESLVLGLEAEVLYLCAHLVLHHQGQGWRWLMDIAGLAASEVEHLNWPLLLEKAQAYDLVTPLQTVLPQLAADWGVPIPHPWLAAVQAVPVSPAEQRVAAWLLAEDRPVIRRFWVDLASLAGWRPRLAYALAHLFPTAAYMQQRYALAHRWLVPLAYPYRWAVGLRELLEIRASH